MKASRWVFVLVGVGLSLAGCSSSSGNGGSSQPLPVDTVPIPVDTVAPTTAAPPTTVVATTVAPDSEAALRARVLEYYEALGQENLRLPSPDINRLRKFFLSTETADFELSPLMEAAKAENWVEANNPVVDEIALHNFLRTSTGTVVSLCVADNYVMKGPGPDGIAGTNDDVLISSELLVTELTEVWALTDGLWKRQNLAESVDRPGRSSCADS